MLQTYKGQHWKAGVLLYIILKSTACDSHQLGLSSNNVIAVLLSLELYWDSHIL